MGERLGSGADLLAAQGGMADFPIPDAGLTHTDRSADLTAQELLAIAHDPRVMPEITNGTHPTTHTNDTVNEGSDHIHTDS